MHPAAAPQSSTPASTSSAQSSPLQRGKACLPCRRRKMKCDGTKPICTPCLRGERAEDCEYTDGQRRPLTLTLEEEIARLRARIQELENPETALPSVELYTPYASAGAGGSAPSASTSVGQGQVQLEPPASHHPAAGKRRAVSHEPPSDDTAEPRQGDIETDMQLHAGRALSAVAPHATELGFFLNFDRLRRQGAPVLPALKSVLTLWSILITAASSSDPVQVWERYRVLKSTLISQTQAQLASALSTFDAEPDPVMSLHVIQTGVLLSYYMQRMGQVIAARYHASGTWTLMMMMRLYQRPQLSGGAREGHAARGSGIGERPTHASASLDVNVRALASPGYAGLAPALDGIEAEERVGAFWAVYALDRWFGLVCDVPFHPLTMDGRSKEMMTVPWPGTRGVVETRSSVMQHFLNDMNHDFAPEGAPAMQAKTSALLGEAVVVARSFVSDPTIGQSAAFRTHFMALDALLQRCLCAAIKLASLPRQTRTHEQTRALVTVHLAALATIHLHRPFIPTSMSSRQRCVEGALNVVRVLDQLGETWGKVGAISPIYGVVWTTLCVTLQDELLRLRARPDADPLRRYEDEAVRTIRKLVSVLSTLSQRCPDRFFAAFIESLLPVLGSIAV